MSPKLIYNTDNGLKYIYDETDEKSIYDEENGVIRMTEKDWKKFKKELGYE